MKNNETWFDITNKTNKKFLVERVNCIHEMQNNSNPTIFMDWSKIPNFLRTLLSQILKHDLANM